MNNCVLVWTQSLACIIHHLVPIEETVILYSGIIPRVWNMTLSKYTCHFKILLTLLSRVQSVPFSAFLFVCLKAMESFSLSIYVLLSCDWSCKNVQSLQDTEPVRPFFCDFHRHCAVHWYNSLRLTVRRPYVLWMHVR